MCDKKANSGEDAQWTREKIQALGMTCGIETAGKILGVGRTVAYRLAREDQWPTPIRVAWSDGGSGAFGVSGSVISTDRWRSLG